jgi:hypothetical protein
MLHQRLHGGTGTSNTTVIALLFEALHTWTLRKVVDLHVGLTKGATPHHSVV